MLRRRKSEMSESQVMSRSDSNSVGGISISGRGRTKSQAGNSYLIDCTFILAIGDDQIRRLREQRLALRDEMRVFTGRSKRPSTPILIATESMKPLLKSLHECGLSIGGKGRPNSDKVISRLCLS